MFNWYICIYFGIYVIFLQHIKDIIYKFCKYFYKNVLSFLSVKYPI